MGRFILIVLDSFGIGAMDDVSETRPADVGANTCKHILQAVPQLVLPTLRKLGLMNALGEEIGGMTYSEEAVFGTIELMHDGADTFYGHQELMGTLPRKPLLQPFREVAESVCQVLLEYGYDVRFEGEAAEGRLLTVNGCVTVGDNLETDPGQVYNVSGCLDAVSFEEIVAIARVVRGVARVSRVIALGGEGVSFREVLGARAAKGNGVYVGIDTPRSGLYRRGYQVLHLGYGIDASVQLPTILGEEGIEVSLIGKVADIVDNPRGRMLPGVETETLFRHLFQETNRIRHGLICLNVQETDLAGHAEDAFRYADRLRVSDAAIGLLLDRLEEEDLLIVTADHGNDPTIGHSRHTRERVPLLVHRHGVAGAGLGRLRTLSDIAATAADYFGVKRPENGQSFLSSL